MTVELISPFPFEALPRVWRWMETFRDQVGDDFAPQSEREFMDYMYARWKHITTWAIVGDGELCGLMIFEQLTPWLGTAHLLIKREFQNRGIAVRACRQAFAEMFKRSGIGKLQFDVLARNRAVGSLLINIGAQREGTLCDQTLRDGKPQDVWLYGLTKAAFHAQQVRLKDKRHVISLQTDHADLDKQPAAVANR